MKHEVSDTEARAQVDVDLVEKGGSEAPAEYNWNDDPENPYNWPKWRKNLLLAVTATIAFSGYIDAFQSTKPSLANSYPS